MHNDRQRRQVHQYTKPKLRGQIKKKLEASDKGGRPNQWSARKSQLLVQEYEREGGGYKQPAEGKDDAAKSLEKWTSEDWQTREGEARARSGTTTNRYLPKDAWDQLSDGEKAATDRKKLTASKKGQQFVELANAVHKT